MTPGSKDFKLGSSGQVASPSASKNAGVVVVRCCTWKCVWTAISGMVCVFLR